MVGYLGHELKSLSQMNGSDHLCSFPVHYTGGVSQEMIDTDIKLCHIVTPYIDNTFMCRGTVPICCPHPICVVVF